MIEAYIPSPPDPTLDFGEYYILDDNDKIQRVYICDIYPDHIEGTLYGVRYSKTSKRYGGDGYGRTHMWNLYDNKEDCRAQTHACYDGWERLRELQKEKET